MIDTAIRLVKKELDVVSMIERFQTIDNLKEMFLDVSQIKMLEKMPKPVIEPENFLRRKEKVS